MLLGAPVGAATGARYAVKAHGSELEYAMRGNEELAAWGRQTLAGAEVRLYEAGTKTVLGTRLVDNSVLR